MAEKPRSPGASDEPSIEEILGSIRRIIAEDDDVPAQANAEEVDEEPLELTNKIDPDGMIVQPEPAVFEEPVFEPTITIEEPTIIIEEPTIKDAPPIPSQKVAFAEEVPPMPSNNEDEFTDTLVSETTAQATTAVMAQLARRTAVTEEGHDGVTIEAIVREMLKPMLRDWLDNNLPEIVQKVVEREMERLSKRV